MILFAIKIRRQREQKKNQFLLSEMNFLYRNTVAIDQNNNNKKIERNSHHIFYTKKIRQNFFLHIHVKRYQ